VVVALLIDCKSLYMTASEVFQLLIEESTRKLAIHLSDIITGRVLSPDKRRVENRAEIVIME
jgi:hypothetical protein